MNNLFKNRSITACMKASYDLMTSRLGSLVKKTWWAVLAYALLTSLLAYFRIPNKGLHDWGVESPMAAFVLQTLLGLLTALGTVLAGATVWSWLNRRPLGWNLWRFFLMCVITDLITMVFTGGMLSVSLAPVSTGLQAGIALALLALFLALILPFGYVLPHVMLLEEGAKLRPWLSFAKGLRHAGGIFMLTFLSLLIIGVIAFVVCLPASILCGAQTLAQLGALEGDELGLPSYFTPLLLAVLTLIIFVFYYAGAWLGISYAYLYGSYRAQEEERKQQESGGQITSY